MPGKDHTDLCPKCGDSGWVMYAREAPRGEIEAAYRLCDCTDDAGTPTPKMCQAPDCQTSISNDKSFCGTHWAEWDMKAHAENWKIATEILEHLARGIHTGHRLDELDEAMNSAIVQARAATRFYEASTSYLLRFRLVLCHSFTDG